MSMKQMLLKYSGAICTPTHMKGIKLFKSKLKELIKAWEIFL